MRTGAVRALCTPRCRQGSLLSTFRGDLNGNPSPVWTHQRPVMPPIPGDDDLSENPSPVWTHAHALTHPTHMLCTLGCSEQACVTGPPSPNAYALHSRVFRRRMMPRNHLTQRSQCTRAHTIHSSVVTVVERCWVHSLPSPPSTPSLISILHSLAFPFCPVPSYFLDASVSFGESANNAAVDVLISQPSSNWMVCNHPATPVPGVDTAPIMPFHQSQVKTRVPPCCSTNRR
jgi:hypothetical protein